MPNQRLMQSEPVLAIDAFHSELVMQSIDAGLRKEVPQRQTEDRIGTARKDGEIGAPYR